MCFKNTFNMLRLEELISNFVKNINHFLFSNVLCSTGNDLLSYVHKTYVFFLHRKKAKKDEF